MSRAFRQAWGIQEKNGRPEQIGIINLFNVKFEATPRFAGLTTTQKCAVFDGEAMASCPTGVPLFKQESGIRLSHMLPTNT
jgi:hypothetical protein